MSGDLLADLENLIAGMDPARRKELARIAEHKLRQAWLPNPGPQAQAYISNADVLLYGGAAGGGKTELLLGLALTTQRRSVIFRRAYVDLRGAEDRLIEIVKTRDGYNGQDMVYKSKGRMLEFGALDKPGAEFTWQGRPHDFIGFDEGAQLSADKVSYVCGWLRSTDPKVRKRVVIATNPPMGGEGEWLMEWFAPWLNPDYPNPARPGELRWCITVQQRTRWVNGPGATVVDGEKYTHESRTFIPAKLDSNPYLKDTGYRSRLENMPEPLRSQLLYGDFLAGREDHEWQVIPTAWVKAAQSRWRAAPEKHRTMIALAMDVAMGGSDDTTIAALHEDAWFAPIIKRKGVAMDDPSQHAALLVQTRRDEADISVDGTGGWGTGVVSHLKHQHGISAAALVFSRKSEHKAKDGKLGFRNLRAEMYWRFREALNPDSGEGICLPPDPRLLAQLTTARYLVRGTDILIEDKDEIRKRTGGSTDDGDAIVMAWHRRAASIRRNKAEVAGLPPVEEWRPPMVVPGRNDAWLMS